MPGNIVGEAWVAIRPDLSGFESELLEKLGFSMRKVQAYADATPITLRVKVDTSEAVAQIAALRAAAGGALGGGSGGGFGSGVAAGAAGGDAGKGGGGGFVTGAALTNLFGFGPGGGTGVTIPWTGITMAGAFSLASMAGLGFEHVLFTLLGLIGSLTGAIGGGLLLALGALGVAMVGMGSDFAVMSSTIADTETLYKQIQTIHQVTFQYGANSAQAKSAQEVLKVDMQMISNTAGVAAELALAKSTDALNIYWDKMTSNARIAAVSILQQFVTLGHDFVPLVANAATRNFGIITDAIKPLLAWLEGPEGTGIFDHLEDVFARNLPATIDAFTQGIEFLLKTFNYLADSTGGFTQKVDNLFKTANSPDGFLRWEHTMDTLIGMFHTWVGFFVIAFKDVVDLFKLTAGLGTGIISTLTGMLTQLHAWLNLTSTKDSLHNLFEIHKQEVLTILQLLPSLLGALANVYLAVAPLLTKALTDVLQILLPILQALTSNAWGAWFLGVGLILTKLGLLGPVFSLIKGTLAGMLGLSGTSSAGQGILADVTGGQKVFVTNWAMIAGAGNPEGAATGEEVGGVSLLSRLGSLVPVIAGSVVAALGLGALGLDIGQLFGGKGSVAAGVGQGVGSIGGGAGAGALIGTLFGPGPGTLAGAIIGAVVGSLPVIATHWNQITKAIGSFFGTIGHWFFTFSVPNTIKTVSDAVSSFFGSIAHWWSTFSWTGTAKTVGSAITGLLSSVGTWFSQRWKTITGVVATTARDITGMFNAIGHWFFTFNWHNAANNLGNSIHGMLAGITSWALGQTTTNKQNLVQVHSAMGDWMFAIVHYIEGQIAKLPGTLATIGTAFSNYVAAIGHSLLAQAVKTPGILAAVGRDFSSWVVIIGDWFIGQIIKIPGSLKTITNATAGFFQAIWNGITTLAKKVVQDFASIGSDISSFITHLFTGKSTNPKNVPSWWPGAGGTTWGATGLFIDKPTIIGAGEGGPEVLLNQAQFRAMMGGGGYSRSAPSVQQVNNFYGVGKETADLMDSRIQVNNRQLIKALGAL